jgi:hypothetical protein
MTTIFIKNNIDTFIAIIQYFTDDARCLVRKLSQNYSLEIDSKLPANTFFKLKNQTQSGCIEKQWSYFLHGYECRFKHENGHIVEVILTFENEYGALNPAFLGKYIRTNPKHINMSTRIQDDFEDGLKIIKTLQENNLLLIINNQAEAIVEFENDKAVYIQKTFKGVKLKG